jgi:uncharacterized protein (DUF58 family)
MPTATPHFIDPAQLAELGDLQLLARTVVDGMMAGLHRSPNTGSSIEFAQYRPYAQGDDPRFVDWKLFSRTDRLHVKQHEEDTTMRCTILLDCSASMDYTSGRVTKFDYGRMLAACIAMLLQLQRDAVGLVAYHEKLVTYVPPESTRHHVRRIFVELEGLKPQGPTDTAGALHFLGDVLKPRGMIVLISDLLHPIELMIDHLRSLRARRHDVLVLQLSDPAEQSFPFEATSTFIDAETGREQYAVPSAVRAAYLENRNRHFARLRTECLAFEIDIEEFTSTEPLDRALHFFLHRRNHALVRSSRRALARHGAG